MDSIKCKATSFQGLCGAGGDNHPQDSQQGPTVRLSKKPTDEVTHVRHQNRVLLWEEITSGTITPGIGSVILI